MHVVRKVLLGLAGSALAFFLFVLAVDAGLIQVAGSPEPIKKILADSGIYQSAVSGTLEQAKTQSGSKTEIPLSQAAIMTAAEQTFTPQFVQANTEKVIDGIYHWLDGKSAEPDFRLDLSGAKATFADKVAQIAKDRAASLPTCTTLPSSTASIDVFSATCLPPGVTPNQVAIEARDTILHGQGFLDDPIITADTIKSNGTNQSIFTDQLKQVPEAYQAIKATPIVFGLLALLALLAVIFLSNSRPKGVRHAGFVLIGTGVLLVILALGTNSVVKNQALPKINIDNKVLQTDLRQLTDDAVHRVNNTVLVFGGSYIVLGALGIGGFYLWRPKRSAETPAQDKHIEPESAKDKVTERSAEPKPKPKTKKIDVK